MYDEKEIIESLNIIYVLNLMCGENVFVIIFC